MYRVIGSARLASLLSPTLEAIQFHLSHQMTAMKQLALARVLHSRRKIALQRWPLFAGSSKQAAGIIVGQLLRRSYQTHRLGRQFILFDELWSSLLLASRCLDRMQIDATS